jgi:hypothetical protein
VHFCLLTWHRSLSSRGDDILSLSLLPPCRLLTYVSTFVQHQDHLTILNNNARSYLLGPQFCLSTQVTQCFFRVVCFISSCTCSSISLCFDVSQLLLSTHFFQVTFASCVVFIRAHELPPKTFVWCVAILHGHEPLPVTFVSLIVLPHGSEASSSDLCVMCCNSSRALSSSMAPLRHIETASVEQHQT